MEKILLIFQCLEGKIAVVTGAARGIGRATAVAFARAGAHVVGIDICEAVYPKSGVKPSMIDELNETGQQVKAEGQRWLAIQLLSGELLDL